MPDVRLLHADTEQLDRAAIAIADGTAFVIALCPPDARIAALTYLRAHVKGLQFSTLVEMGSADEMFAGLLEQVEHKNRVLSMHLGRDTLGAFDALNLHREKVLKGGPVLLWLDDVEALRSMRERAPDAYSYRTTMMVIRGDGGELPKAPVEESEEIKTLRKRLKRAKTPLARAAEAYNLAERLRVSGRIEDAAGMARAALCALPHAMTDMERKIRALSCRTLALVENWQLQGIQEIYWARRGYTELDARTSFSDTLGATVDVLSIWPGPFGGHDRLRVEEGLSLLRRFGLPLRDYSMVMVSGVEIAIAQGDFAKGFRLLNELAGAAAARQDIALDRLLRQGKLLAGRGNLLEAEAVIRATLQHAAQSGASTWGYCIQIVNCMSLRGELEAAERFADENSAIGARLGIARYFHARIHAVRGDIAASFADLHRMLDDASQVARDGEMMEATDGIVEVALMGHDAHRLSPETLQSMLSDLDLAIDVITELAGPDGPEWYPIQLRSRKAEILRIAGQTTQALDLLREALQLARETYPDLLPETGRILVDHLLYARQFDEALTLTDEIEKSALETGFLEERARLVAGRVLALVGKAAPAERISSELNALREATAATDSKRITAETLRYLAQRLPMTSISPDPMALAEEAHRLFVAMPIPGEEARCLEIMGDALAARGHVADAKMRYASARGRLERHGILLRVPLLEEKLAGL